MNQWSKSTISLHNFLNGKYMLFSLYKKKKKLYEKYESTWLTQLNHNPIDPNPFLTCLKWPILTYNPFDPQLNWPDPNITWLARFAMSSCNIRIFSNLLK